MRRFLFLVGLSVPLWGKARAGLEEHYEQFVTRAGAIVKSPLPMSALYGTQIRVPEGAVSRRTRFSISAQSDGCPYLPDNMMDISPPMTFEPISRKFSRRVTFRIALTSSYTPMLTHSKLSELNPSDLFPGSVLWATYPHKGWRKVSGYTKSKDYMEITADQLNARCYTVVVKRRK